MTTEELLDENYLKRDILVHICRDGTLSFRAKDEPVFNGRALPVFSVDTKEEAKKLIVLVGSLQINSHPLMPDEKWYVLAGFGGELEDLPDVSEKLHQYYSVIKK